MGLALMAALYAVLTVALRWAAGRIGPPVPAKTALVLAVLPLPFVGGGFLPGKVLAPTNSLAGNAPWCAPDFVEAASRRSTAGNPLLFDALSQGEPWRRAIRDDLLFNPAAGAGAALLANAQSAPLYPPELLGRLLPQARAASWAQAARLLVAGFGMFLLARTVAFRNANALVAATAFVSASFLQLWRVHALASVAAMTPWVLAAAFQLARRPSGRAAVTLAIVGATAFAAGHPETLLQSASLALFAVVPTLVLARRKPGRPRAVPLALAWGAAAGVLSAFLAAPVLLPFLEAMRVSESWAYRQAGIVPPVEEHGRKMAGRLATAVELLVRGDPVSGTFRGASNLVESGGGAVGAATLVLAAAALACRRRRRFVVSWLLLGSAGLLVSAHVPGVARLALLVPWLGHSVLDRLSLWWVVAASLLAGLGSTEILRRRGRLWAGAAGVGLLLALAGFAAAVPMARRPLALGIELAGLAGAVAIGLGAALPAVARTSVVLLAVVAPRAFFFSTWVPVSSSETFFPETAAVRFVRERAAGFRVAGVGTALWPASAAFFGLEDPRACDPMTFVDYARLTSWIGRERVAAWPFIEDPLAPSLRFLGVRYLFDRPDAPARPPLVEVYRGADATVFENRAALRRAFVPRRVLVVRNAPAAAVSTKDLSDPAADAVLTTAAWPAGTVLTNGDAEIRDLLVERGGVSFRASVRSPALVATSQPAVPGWTVEVDGHTIRPERVDTAFLGVLLTPGERHVRMRYAPASFRAGVGLFGIGVLLAIAAVRPRGVRSLLRGVANLGRRALRAVAPGPSGATGSAPAVRRRVAAVAIVVVVAALVGGSLWVTAGLPLVALGNLAHDDALYVKLAGHVARGEWLGPYDESTLAKGPGFPFFVALSYRAGLPLLLASRLFAAAASGLFVLALLPLFRGRGVPLLLLASLLFNPVVVTRAARELVYPSLTLVTLAGAAGLFLSLPASRGRAAAWATLCGLGLGAVWLTREEGVWLVPAVAILLVATVVRTARAEGVSRPLAEASGLAALPVLLLGASLLAVSLVNLRVYGVFTARESTGEPFLSAYGALARILPAAPIPRVPVPREVRLRAYAQSPALRSLEPYLEGAVGRAFVESSEALGMDSKGDIAGGWLQFALRGAAAMRGEYRDARTAAAFWRRVAKELDGACDAGRLPCGPNPRSMMPPGALSQLPVVVAQLPGTLAFLVRSVDSAPALRNPGWSQGSGAERAAFARITRERLAPAPDEPRWFVLQGWAFQRGGPPVDWRVRGADGASVPFGVRRLPSGDVAVAFGAADAVDARVELLATCPGPCVVELVGSGGPLVRFDPSRPEERSGRAPPGFEMSVDAVEVASPPGGPGVWERNEARQGGLKRIAAAYRGLLEPGFPAAVALLVLGAAVAAVRRRGGAAVVVAAALLVGVVSRVALLALVDRTSFPALHYLYLAPAYPLLYAFVVLAAVSAVSSLRRGAGPGDLWTNAATFGFTSRSKSA